MTIRPNAASPPSFSRIAHPKDARSSGPALRRVRSDGERFVKTALPGSRSERQQDLRGEFEILMRVRGIPGVPAVFDLVDDGTGQALVMERVAHPPLDCMGMTWPGLLAILFRLSQIVWKLARRGVSHDDLRPENILISENGEVFLVDFDQATTGSFGRCLARSLLGLRAGGPPVQNSILAPVRERLQTSLSPRLIRWLKGQRLGTIAGAPLPIPALPPDASPRIRALHRAWELASGSDASAPGRATAYYALEVEGVRFPGERPWAERWRLLGGVTSCAGRRVLEIGCNMALLSIYLLRESGAAAALAVDRDPTILAAAAEVAAALQVRPELRRVDLDDDADWEASLAAYRARRGVLSQRAELGARRGAPPCLFRTVRRAGLRGPRQRPDGSAAATRRRLRLDPPGRDQRARATDPALPQARGPVGSGIKDDLRRLVAEMCTVLVRFTADGYMAA
jgi:predicted Ser/Thr protein kinase/SAM-dependent methyltransferase